jgi:hypothetical protein
MLRFNTQPLARTVWVTRSCATQSYEMHCALDVTTDLAPVVVDQGDLSCMLLGDGLCFYPIDCDGTPKVTERGLMHIALRCVVLTRVPLRSNDRTRH